MPVADKGPIKRPRVDKPAPSKQQDQRQKIKQESGLPNYETEEDDKYEHVKEIKKMKVGYEDG